MKKNRLYPLFVLTGLAGTVLLAVLFWPVLEANLIEPLALVAWFFRRLILSINQEILWTLLVLAAIWLGLRLLPARSEQAIRRFHKHDQKQPLDRFGAWRDLFRAATTDPNSQEALATNLKKLLVEVVCAAEHKSPSEVETALAAGQLYLPAEVADYLSPRKPPRPNPLQAIRWTLAHLPRQVAERIAPNLIQPPKAAGAVLRYLETYLENPDDNL